jgi:hypothetical protein
MIIKGTFATRPIMFAVVCDELEVDDDMNVIGVRLDPNAEYKAEMMEMHGAKYVLLHAPGYDRRTAMAREREPRSAKAVVNQAPPQDEYPKDPEQERMHPTKPRSDKDVVTSDQPVSDDTGKVRQ